MDDNSKLETGTASTETGTGSPELASTSSAAVRGRFNPDELHDLFEGPAGGEASDPEDPFAQMRNDPNYAALIKDLEAIAAAAHQLFANDGDEPSDKVWDNIVGKLGEKDE